jgi:hypothetical protein
MVLRIHYKKQKSHRVTHAAKLPRLDGIDYLIIYTDKAYLSTEILREVKIG